MANSLLLATLFLTLSSPAAPSVAEPLQAVAQQPESVHMLSVREAMKRLERDNPQLASTRLRLKAAEQALDHAKVPLLPKASLGGNYTFNNAEATLSMSSIFDGIEDGLQAATMQPITLDRSEIPEDTVMQAMNRVTGSVRVQVPVLVAHAIGELKLRRRSLATHKLNADDQRAQLKAALLQLAWTLDAAKAQLKIAERALDYAQRHADTAQRRLDAGAATQLELDQAKTQVLRRSFGVEQAKSQIESLHISIAALLGVDGQVAIERPAEPQIAGNYTQLLQRAQKQLPALQRERLAGALARDKARNANLHWVPTVQASAAAQLSSVPLIAGDNYAWTAGVDLSWTVFDGGARRAARKSAEIEALQAKARLRALDNDLRAGLRDALRSIELAEAGERMAEAELALAHRSADASQRRFAAGSLNSLAALDALDRLADAEVRRAEARSKRQLAAVEVQRLTGQLPD